MVSREILNSHPISTLKKEISKVNIKKYSKLKKPQLVELMLKYKERFSHIKMAEKPARAPRAAKPKKEDKPKIPKPPPAPAAKAGSAPSGNLGADIKKTARQKAQDRTVKKSKALRAATAAAKEGRARTAQRSQVSDFLGQIGGSGKSEQVKKTADKKIELAGGKPPKKKAPAKKKASKDDPSFAASKKLTGLTKEQLNKLDPAELFGLLPKTARKNVLDPKATGVQVAKADWRDRKMKQNDEQMLKALKAYFKVNGKPTEFNDLKILDGKLYVNTTKYHGEGHRDDVDAKTTISDYDKGGWKRFTDRYWGAGAINGNPESQSGRYNILKNLKEGEITMAKKEKVKGAETIPTFMNTGESWKGNLVKNVRYKHGDYQKKGKKVFDPYGQKDWTFIKPEDYRRFRLGSEKTDNLKRRAAAKEIEVYSQGEGRDKWDSKVMVYDTGKKEFREFD